MRLRMYCLLAVFWPVLNCYCQNSTTSIRPLTVGDYVPSVEINNILNYSSTSIKLGEYTSNNLLILDFMSLGCISCRRALPRFDSLRSQFGNALQIVLVTSDSKQRFTSFLKSNKQGKELHFPVVIEDTLLQSWFPHQLISHIVWIYKNKVIAITGAEYVVGKNIEDALSGERLPWPIKKDITTYDYSQPLFVFNNSLPQYGDATIQYTTAIRSSLPGVTRRFLHSVDSASGTRRILFINYPLLDIYLKSYGLPLYYPKEWIQLNVPDKGRFVYSQGYKQQWTLDNTFCYETVLPLFLSPSQYWQKIRTDIDSYFNIQSHVEKRDTTYLIISQTNYSNH